jgi:hypothetical protein
LDKPVDWTVFGIWLTMLLHRHGNEVLRVKGILNTADAETPVAVHGSSASRPSPDAYDRLDRHGPAVASGVHRQRPFGRSAVTVRSAPRAPFDAISICISKPSTRPRRPVVPCSKCSASSEFERSIIRSRVKAGLARARLYGTKSGKPIGQQPLAPHKAEEIRAELQKGTGILKTARLCGTGVSAVQRIKAMIKQAA